MLHLLDIKSIRVSFLMCLLFGILAQKGGLKLRSEKRINFSVYYSPWLFGTRYCELDIGMVAAGNPADLGNILLTRCCVIILVPISLNKLPGSERW